MFAHPHFLIQVMVKPDITQNTCFTYTEPISLPKWVFPNLHIHPQHFFPTKISDPPVFLEHRGSHHPSLDQGTTWSPGSNSGPLVVRRVPWCGSPGDPCNKREGRAKKMWSPIWIPYKGYKMLERGAKWCRYRVSIHHPLGSNWHPLEGAGIKICSNVCRLSIK